MSVVIDVHCHLFPTPYLRRVQQLLAHPKTPTEISTRNLLDNTILRVRGMSDVDARLEVMDEHGIDAQVLSMPIPGTYEGSEADRCDLARIVNDAYAEIVAAAPTRFAALASLPLPHADASLAELSRCLDELGMVGVFLGTNVNGVRLDDQVFAPVYEELDRRGASVFLHPMTPDFADVLVDYNLQATLGLKFETGITVHRMVFSGVFERYPRIKFVIPHMGGILPFVMARLDATYRTGQAGADLPHPPSVYLRRLYYDTVNYQAESVRFVADLFGADHLLFGTDYPFRLSDVGAAVQSIDDTSLTAAERADIMSGTAQRVFGLAPIMSAGRAVPATEAPVGGAP